LRSKGFKITLSSRDPKKGQSLAREFEAEFLAWADVSRSGSWPLAVNASSASSPEELGSDYPRVKLSPGALMIDVNYGRAENVWRNAALSQGAAFKDGLGMLALQALESFKIWTGQDPGAECFLSALKDFLKK
jgi:shikimate dehydrogenase